MDLTLPPLATSAGEARRLLRDALSGVDAEDSLDAAQVAVSEIVTNALVHAGTPMRLRVLLGGGVRVELSDGSPHLPHRRDYSSVAATGRGLHMVSQMVDKWGAYPDGEGKVVWFEIEDELDGAASEHVEGVGERSVGADSVAVELRNMPLLMHAAWQEHAAGLLRELMLIRLEDDLEAIEHHAALSDALNILFEQVPLPDIGEDAEAIMAGATEPGVSASELRLQVPPESLGHFDNLDLALEEAVTLAELGELLSPPTQPEIRIMRKWLCSEIRQQAAGQAPTAWVSPTDARPPEINSQLDWDPTEVNTSTRTLIAADDTSRIVAASPSAVTALGYPDTESLVGQRLVSIIPTRFHQAHIAGFTLHLVNGRSPLLGTPVRVPVVRADGTEVETELVVEATSLPNGRRLFTAELFD